MSSLNYLELCRLCLVKDRVQIPIFEEEGDIRQIFLKIAACLPVKVNKDDKLPKKICNDCMYKVEMLYQFRNTAENAEKRLLEWLGEAVEEKKCASDSHVKQESLEQDPCSELAKSLSRVEAVLAEARETESDTDQFASAKPETDSDDEPLSTLETTSFVNVDLDGTGTTESHTQGEFLAPGAPSTSKTISSTNSQTATSGFLAVYSSSQEDSLEQALCESGVRQQTEPKATRRRIKGMKKVTAKRKKEIENLIVDIFQQKLQKKQGNSCIDDTVTDETRTSTKESTSGLASKVLEEDMLTCGNIDDMKSDGGGRGFSGDVTPGSEKGGKKRTKTKKIITCEFCGKNFERNGNYLEHRRTHTGEKPYECGVCLMRFGSHAGLSRHKFVHQDSRTFACDICNKIFKHQIQLKYHKETHTNTTPLNCDMCSYVTLSKHYLNLHRATHVNRDRFVCGACNKGFNSRTYLLEHMNKHSGDKPFLCDKCGKSYPARYSLAIHKQMKHDPNYKPRGRVPCQFCGKMILNRKQDLVRHRGIHTGEKPYVCHFCGKAVTNRESLKTHVRLHTGEKPFSCDTCGSNFVSKNLLRVHKRTHTGEKPYCCTLCDKSFTQRSSLVVHQRTHATSCLLECEHCKKTFSNFNALQEHMKTHASGILVYRVLT